MKQCICCKGPFHPATGHYYSYTKNGEEINVPCCGACFRPFFKWVKGHTQMTGKVGKVKVRFYEAAAKFKERE